MKKAVRIGTTSDPIIFTIISHDAKLRARGITTRGEWVKGHSVCVGNNIADYLAGVGFEAAAQGATPGTYYDNLDNNRLDAVVQRTLNRKKLEDMRRKRGVMTTKQYKRWLRSSDGVVPGSYEAQMKTLLRGLPYY